MVELAMSKGLAMTAFVVSILLTLVFGLDLAMGVPFGQPDFTMGLGFVIASVILAYISFMTWREQV